MVEHQLLTEEMCRIRAALEIALLQLAYVDFVSVAFRQEDERTLLVTIGTTRPDLVVAVLLTLVTPIVLEQLTAHLAEGRWQPEFQILKGRTLSCALHL